LLVSALGLASAFAEDEAVLDEPDEPDEEDSAVELPLSAFSDFSLCSPLLFSFFPPSFFPPPSLLSFDSPSPEDSLVFPPGTWSFFA
jgi:hypothetical protein